MKPFPLAPDRRYKVSGAVRAAVGVALDDMLVASPTGYQCVLCYEDGDASREDTAVVIVAANGIDTVMFAHQRCSGSRVMTIQELGGGCALSLAASLSLAAPSDTGASDHQATAFMLDPARVPQTPSRRSANSAAAEASDQSIGQGYPDVT